MTKAEFARALGIEQSGVSALEADGSWPTTKNLDRVLTVLGASAYDLAAALDAINGRTPPPGSEEVREPSADPLYAALTLIQRANADDLDRKYRERIQALERDVQELRGAKRQRDGQ